MTFEILAYMCIRDVNVVTFSNLVVEKVPKSGFSFISFSPRNIFLILKIKHFYLIIVSGILFFCFVFVFSSTSAWKTFYIHYFIFLKSNLKLSLVHSS